MMIVLASLLSLVMVITAIWVVITKSILKAIIIFAVVSLVSAVSFIFMHAPDVAITEASIGAGITTAIFILSYKRISE
ncbi:Na(+)/H(+) antiporter subunit B [Helicovermis profundi]|uniref:Na(+)/H(+) antiporter subunit B n=1 Tax=Helicovermis profundi TaxID=3065157 RepID=A0AAU9E5M7_9FIRM|nr:Na(+)/H(+) antiporter subunit B [Clostridia bacterium S502]